MPDITVNLTDTENKSLEYVTTSDKLPTVFVESRETTLHVTAIFLKNNQYIPILLWLIFSLYSLPDASALRAAAVLTIPRV